MGAYYDEIEIEDMAWDEAKGVYHYPCPCGDRFEISRTQLANYEDIAMCPSCSLIIRVIYDPLDFQDDPEEDDSASGAESETESESDSLSDTTNEETTKDDKVTVLEGAFGKLAVSASGLDGKHASDSSMRTSLVDSVEVMEEGTGCLSVVLVNVRLFARSLLHHDEYRIYYR
ncbi:DPH3 [Sanghuangporus vaninii]